MQTPIRGRHGASNTHTVLRSFSGLRHLKFLAGTSEGLGAASQRLERTLQPRRRTPDGLAEKVELGRTVDLRLREVWQNLFLKPLGHLSKQIQTKVGTRLARRVFFELFR